MSTTTIISDSNNKTPSSENAESSEGENALLKEEEDESDGHHAEDEVEIVNINETDDENSSENIRRLSIYELARKKSAAQGLMDIALLTSNANQLRYILEFNRKSHSFLITIVLIITSLILQVAVAMFLIFQGRYYIKGESKSINAKRVKSFLLFGVFLITVINIFIASFTTLDSSSNK